MNKQESATGQNDEATPAETAEMLDDAQQAFHEAQAESELFQALLFVAVRHLDEPGREAVALAATHAMKDKKLSPPSLFALLNGLLSECNDTSKGGERA